jgi:hypothetical protein
MFQSISIWNSSVFEICCMKDWIYLWISLCLYMFGVVTGPHTKFHCCIECCMIEILQGMENWFGSVIFPFVLYQRLRPSNLLDLPYNLKLFTLLFLSFIHIYFEGHVLWMQSKNMVTDLFTYCVILLMTLCKWHFTCQEQISLLCFFDYVAFKSCCCSE